MARALERQRLLRAPSMLHIGHSTHLVSVGAARILTDPWFYDPAFGALEHAAGPAAAPAEVGTLDAVFVSHEHPDHADTRALEELDKGALVLAPTRELAARIRAMGFGAVEQVAPWQDLTIAGVRLTVTPAVHDVPEVGFVARAAEDAVYFAGDTALFGGMVEIAERLTPTAAILPVDGTRIRGQPLVVMGPEEARRATERLGVRIAVASHAQAAFTDPLAERVLTTSVPRAAEAFVRAIRSTLPGVRAVAPAAGEVVLLG